MIKGNKFYLLIFILLISFKLSYPQNSVQTAIEINDIESEEKEIIDQDSNSDSLPKLDNAIQKLRDVIKKYSELFLKATRLFKKVLQKVIEKSQKALKFLEKQKGIAEEVFETTKNEKEENIKNQAENEGLRSFLENNLESSDHQDNKNDTMIESSSDQDETYNLLEQEKNKKINEKNLDDEKIIQIGQDDDGLKEDLIHHLPSEEKIKYNLDEENVNKKEKEQDENEIEIDKGEQHKKNETQIDDLVRKEQDEKTIEEIEENNQKNKQIQLDDEKEKNTTPKEEQHHSSVLEIKQCLQKFLNSVPQQFCFKQKKDLGQIPKKCPEGYSRNVKVLCQQNCKQGFKKIAAICVENCQEGEIDSGLTCHRSIFDFDFKDTYIPKTITNFNLEVKCKSDQYKQGTLCYRDCKKIDMQNCGTAACSNANINCTNGVAEMGVNVINAETYTLQAFINQLATKEIKELEKEYLIKKFQQVSKQMYQSAFEQLKKDLYTNKFYEDKQNNSSSILLENSDHNIQANQDSQICQQVNEEILTDLENSETVEFQFNKEDFEIFNDKQMSSQCMKKINQDDNQFNENLCIKNVYESIKKTFKGLITLSGLFKDHYCKDF